MMENERTQSNSVYLCTNDLAANGAFSILMRNILYAVMRQRIFGLESDRRNETEIRKIVLRAALVPVSRLQVMHSCFLTNERADRYIELLAEEGLLKCQRDGQLYETTTLGREWLDTKT